MYGKHINLILILTRSPVYVCENFHCVMQCAKHFMYSFNVHNNCEVGCIGPVFYIWWQRHLG